MKSDSGSLTILGLFASIALLATAAVTLNANSLYLQHRQVKNLADSLALDLADLLQNSNSSTVVEEAETELKILNVTGRATEIFSLTISGQKATVTLCQDQDLFFNLSALWESSKVCAKSSAEPY